MKKTLALVLALVMVIGMMAVPASAKFDDVAEIKYTEAVDVVAACGIIEGYNNEFNPTGELTRAAGAKLVAYLELGAKGAEALVAEKAPFADVAKDHWAAGYIGWAASKGYLAGVDGKNFAPDAPLSAIAYAKLMLCALGYDAAIEGYTGSGWEYNVMADALDNNIFKGNDDADFTAVATREEAALYTFNALKADMVKYASKGTQVTINGAVIATGASEAEKVTAADSGKVANETNEDGKQDVVQLAEKRFTKLEKVHTTTTDAFGRPSVEWKYDGEKVGTYSETPDFIFTGKTAEKAVYAAIDGEGADVTITDVWQDGIDDGYSATFRKTNSNNAPFFGYGITVELYETAADTWRLVAIRDYLAEVTDVTEADEDNDTKRSIEVTLDVAPACFETKVVCEAYETEKFEEDDVVVVNVGVKDGKIYVKKIALAEKVEDVVVTAYKKGGMDVAYVTADGETYNYAQNNTVNSTTKTYTMKDASYTFYLDTMGNILKAESYSVDNEDYYLVRDISVYQEGDFAGDDKYFIYKLVSMTGEIVTVKAINVAGNDTTSGEVTTAVADAAENDIVTFEDDDDNEGFVKLTVESDVNNTLTGNKLNNAQAKVATGIIANAKTVFVLQEGTTTAKNSWKVYTGIKNVPNYDSASVTAYAMIDSDDGYADVVFINLGGKTAASQVAKDVIYLLKNTYSSVAFDAAADKNIYYYDAIVDGVKTTIVSADDTLTELTGLVKITEYDADGFVKSIGTLTESTSESATVYYKLNRNINEGREFKYSEGTLSLYNGESIIDDYVLTVNDDTVVYMISSTNALEVGDAADLKGVVEGTGVISVITVDDDDATVAAIYFKGTID